MKLDNAELIKEFTEEQKEKFPDVDAEQFKEICFGPWRYLSNEMESGELNEIRFKYFGTFKVYIGRAKQMLTFTKRRFEKGLLTLKEYQHFTEMINKFLKRENEIKDKL